MDKINIRLLNILQQGVPLVSYPFKEIADLLGISEEAVMTRIKDLKQNGIIRRLGGVFDSPSMGMKSTLCAMIVPPDRIDEVAQKVNAFSEVTHNYLRDNEYNMWFTVTTTSASALDEIQNKIMSDTGLKVTSMPVLQRYKIKVVFELDEE
ncbi:MAG: Lrp/AsnC family transcriptional regulator [Syntrophomonadaceae bacterium]|nr:Lrp/AsnC family transcriptional regulator [Syntrophomonadaceae bacterium]